MKAAESDDALVKASCCLEERVLGGVYSKEADPAVSETLFLQNLGRREGKY
jgi:hypothetical protein